MLHVRELSTAAAPATLRIEGLCVGYESIRLGAHGGVREILGYGRRYFPILNALSFNIQFSQKVATIVGANGSGKTTLLRAIAGAVGCQGDVIWADQRLAGLSQARRLEMGIVFVPHDNGLFPSLTARDHLRLVEPRATVRNDVLGRVRDAMILVDRSLLGTLDFAKSDTRVGDLSGGERRMLSILRLLFRRWSLVLIDEPTSGLSPAWVQAYSVLLTMLGPAYILQVEQYGRAENARAMGSTIYELRDGAVQLPSRPSRGH